MTEVFYGLDAAERDRVAGLRARGTLLLARRLAQRNELDELRRGARDPRGAAFGLCAASADAHASRTFHADGESVVFALRCYVASETPADEAAYRLRPLKVHVLVTGEYLLTLHEERVSLPTALAPDLPEERGKRYVVYSVVDAMLAQHLRGAGGGRAEAGRACPDDRPTRMARRVPKATLRDAGTRLAAMRRWVGAEQAVVQRVGVEVGALRGFDTRRRAVLRACGRAGQPLGGLDRRRRERRRDAAGSAAERAGATWSACWRRSSCRSRSSPGSSA